MDCHCFSLWHVKTLLYFFFLSQVESYQSEEPQESNCSGPAKFFCILLLFAFAFWGQMQCIVFSRVVTKRNVVVVAKPISVVGAARVCLMSLNCSKTWGEDQNSAYHGAKQRAYLCKQIKKKKNNKKQDQRPTYQEKKTGRKRTQCQLY